MSEMVRIGALAFEVRRSPRRKTLGLTVDRSGELVVHAPTGTEESQLVRWTRGKLLWVHQKLALRGEVERASGEPEFVSGEMFWYLGRGHRLQLVQQQEQPLSYGNQVFYLRAGAKPEATEHFKRWYIETGTDWVERRVRMLAQRAGALAARVSLRDLGYRWGSCGRNGALHFNWKLLQLPVRFVDYVIVHELVHLREGHHGPEFWRALERALPDAKERREQLRVKGPAFLKFDVTIVPRGMTVRQ
jgi:predicted metal-dependent hydrolase